MSQPHKFYLSLGSNIQPEMNLAEAIKRLQTYGDVQEVSGTWESHAVGSGGPDYLNLCAAFVVGLEPGQLKRGILRPIEKAMGRVRSRDKNAPRTIDIDIVMMDSRPLNLRRWSYAFVLLPMSELLPQFIHPLNGRPLSEVATETQAKTWIVRHPGVSERSG